MEKVVSSQWKLIESQVTDLRNRIHALETEFSCEIGAVLFENHDKGRVVREIVGNGSSVVDEAMRVLIAFKTEQEKRGQKSTPAGIILPMSMPRA